MLRGKRPHVDGWLFTGAALHAAASIVLLMFASPKTWAVLAAITSATLICLACLRRWLPPVCDLFQRGYQAGWADAAHEFAPAPPLAYPDEPVAKVTPLRQRIRT